MATTRIQSNRRSGAFFPELPPIGFDRWKLSIQTATDLDQLLRIVTTYLGSWTPAQLSTLPLELSSPVLNSCDDLMARAVIASREEVNFTGDARQYPPLREMSLTLLAAASRLRYLQAVRAGRA